MLNKILIFNAESTIKNDVVDKNAKEVFFIELKKNKNIKNTKTFYQMEIYDDAHNFITSTIDTILFQQILPYVTPIIEYIPHSKTISKNITRGGIIFKTDQNVKCMLQNLTEIIVSKFTYINVIGVKINKNLDKTHVYVYNYITNLLDFSKNDLIMSGDISLNNLLIDTYYAFNNQLKYNNMSINIAQSDTLYFNDKNTKDTLNSIICAIQAARDHYEHNVAILYKTIYNSAVLLNKNIRFDHSVYVRPKCLKIVSEMGKIINNDLCYTLNDNVLLNIFNRGYLVNFNKIYITGNKNYDEIKYYTDITNAKHQQGVLLDKNKLEMYKKNNIAVLKFNIQLSDATPTQLLAIEKFYNTAVASVSESQFVYALNNAMDTDNKSEIKSNLNKIKNIKNIEITDKFIKLNGVNLLCSHVIYKANLLLREYNNTIEKNNKIRNLLVSGYYDSSITDGYFCGICGEKLIEKDTEYDIQRSNDYSANEFNPLYTLVYREVTYIVNNFVEFGNVHMHNIYSIINNITDILKNEILDIQSNLLKVKTLGKDSISGVVNIYIYIYAFAFISQLIYTNEFISFKRNIYGGKVVAASINVPEKDVNDLLKSKVISSKKNIQNIQGIINMAISILKKIKGKEINQSSIISMDNINSIFLKAYRFITNINYIVIIDSNVSYWNKNNSFIDYLLYAYKQYEISVKLVPTTDNYAAVLGRSYKTIEENLVTRGIYDTIKLPPVWTKNEYFLGSLMYLYEYIHNGIYLINTPLSKTLSDFYAKYAYLYKLQKEKDAVIKLTQLLPTFKLSVLRSNFIKKYDRVFKHCACGVKKYTYQKLTPSGNYTKNNVTYTLSDINFWLNQKDYNKANAFKLCVLTHVDCECKKTTNSYMSPFYSFYEIKCPLGNLHDFQVIKNITTCVKCLITQDIIKSLDIKYYTKYLPTYTSTKRKEYNLISIPKPHVVKKEVMPVFNKWLVSGNVIHKLSTELKVSDNIIYNLGLTENKEYSENIFSKNNFALELTKDESIKQNNVLFDYYLFIIKNYYLLKNSEVFFDIPLFLKEFITSVVKTSLKKLPAINEDVLNKYVYYKKTLLPHELTNFLLVTISSTLLHIQSIFKIINKTSGDILLRILFNKIIEFERKLSKFDIRKILKRSSDIDLERSLENQNALDMNFIESDDIDENINEDDIDEDIDDDADNVNLTNKNEPDIFSMGDLDIEDDPDNNYIDLVDRQN